MYLTGICLILATFVETECNDIECADCNRHSKGTCKIKEGPGISCGVLNLNARQGQSWVDQTEADDAQPSVTPDLSTCVPSGFNISGRLNLKHPICCIWSPDLGCQILVISGNEFWQCGTCYESFDMNYSELKPCPCTKNLGSSIMYFGPWPFVMALYYTFA